MNNLSEEQKRMVYEFLSKLSTEIDVNSCIDIDNIDIENAFESIREMIEESNGFDIEIIYYYNAMEYLNKNDNSLKESLEIASEMGYEVKNLNSEILASLLASQNSRSEFDELEFEINTFFEDLPTIEDLENRQ